MDYIVTINGSIIAIIFSVLRDIQKSKKSKKPIFVYAAPDFSENKGKAIIIFTKSNSHSWIRG